MRMPEHANRSEDPLAAAAQLVPETVYGNLKRLRWILRHVDEADEVLEVGCGTGRMLVRPLAKLGYRMQGIDLDAPSIELGKKLLEAEGLDSGILTVRPLSSVSVRPDVIIVSEVLEHLRDEELPPFLDEVRACLKPSGTLLVTVPNGYGWFEMESFVWWKLRLGHLLFRSGFCHLVESAKARHLGAEAVAAGEPSTLASSPHVQRFTLSSIIRLLRSSGFEITDARGSVACSGPFTNLLFAGFAGLLERNGRWGDRLGRLASGYFVACRAPDRGGRDS
jgi:2-polyprenyl-3-methyl-5-hydroxy-6-metoxy-1,4-benzoquinol methylase